MLRTIICDDEAPARGLLEDILRGMDTVEVVATCQSAMDAIGLINAGGIDLVFMDIEMPQLSGVEAARHLTIDPRPLIVFATAHSDYAIDAFGIDAIDYILKPLDPVRVEKAVEKARRLHRLIDEAREAHSDMKPATQSASLDAALRVFDAGRLFIIPYGEIVWIEAAGDYSLIHRQEGETAIRRTLSSLERELPTAQFRRIHRSSIVSVGHISEMRRLTKGEAELTLAGGIVLRISRSYRDVVAEFMTE
ncbi:MAG: LytTR family DNA-binding domain-containing protein [Pseudomonadota bacterium]